MHTHYVYRGGILKNTTYGYSEATEHYKNKMYETSLITKQ